MIIEIKIENRKLLCDGFISITNGELEAKKVLVIENDKPIRIDFDRYGGVISGDFNISTCDVPLDLLFK